VTRRTLRLAAAAVCAAVVLPLAACQNHQGTAAYVGDTRITTADVEEQVEKFYDDPFWAKQAEGQEGVVRNRTVSAMILAELLRQAAADVKATVRDSAIDDAEAAFKQQPEQIPQRFLGAPTRIVAEVVARDAAIQAKFKENAKSADELNKALADLGKDLQTRYPVDLNPRYGKFDSTALDLTQGKNAGVRDLPTTPSAPPAQP
jgi:hypothetical protein